MKRKMVNADEYDAFTPWRRVYLYLQRPGVVARIKRKANKRDRASERRLLAEVRKYGADER